MPTPMYSLPKGSVSSGDGADKDALKKLAENGRELESSQKNTLWWTKLVTGILLLAAGTVGMIVTFASEKKFGLKLVASTDYRSAAVLDAIDNAYPAVEFDKFDHGFNVPAAASATSLIAGAANLLNLLLHGREMFQLASGANPYIWLNFALWQFVAFLVFAVLSGVHSVFLLTAISGLVVGWILLFWMADLHNQYAYQYARAWAKLMLGGGAGLFDWLPVVFALVPAVLVYVLLVLYVIETFGAAAFDGPAIQQGYWLAVVIAHLVLYLVNPIVFAVWKAGWITSIFTREMIFYIFNAVFALATTWFTLAMLGADSITLP